MSDIQRVIITGAGGYMGRNLSRLFKANKNYLVFSPPKETLNLLNFKESKEYIERIDPHIVIHAAIKGGTVVDTDTLQDTADNIKMYDNLASIVPENVTIVVLASGSEFDRSQDIDCAVEEDVVRSYPIDPYGLSKNIITRKSMEDTNTMILRLFGCFNHDEDDYRFIKRCILNIKEGKPIVIHQDKMMDFFYMDDAFTMMDFFLQSEGIHYFNGPHLNLVYNEKYSLLNIASMILAATGKKNHPIEIHELGMGRSYTGDGTKLSIILNKNPQTKLIGLEEGIVRTCKALL